MRAEEWLRRAGNATGCELRASCGSEVGDHVEVTMILEGESLNAIDRLFLEIGRQRIFSEKEFVCAIHIFDARPCIIASADAQRGFNEMTIKHRFVMRFPRPSEERSSVPQSSGKEVGDACEGFPVPGCAR